MLQAHSLLWDYLWVAPNILLLVLALLMWRRGLQKQLPAFLALAFVSALGQLAVFVADVVPERYVSAENFWRIDWVNLVTEGIVKFVLIAAIFAGCLVSYSSLAKLGSSLIRGVGVVLMLAAVLAAAYAPADSPYGLINGVHLLDQSIFLVETGLLLFLVLFSSYVHLTLDRRSFGIVLGLAVSACVHLATWAIAANVGWPAEKRHILDFTNMTTYHVCVLIWFFYVLVPGKAPMKSAVPLPENNLELWNRELERLFHS
jgi:hypothetical protein